MTLITTAAAVAAIEAALQESPYLASLPKPKVLAPRDLQAATGTAELLRLPEVQSSIVTDFLLLPCDLVCEIEGKYLLQTWTASQSQSAIAHQQDGRGGLCVYYQADDTTENEVLDLIAVTPLQQSAISARSNRGLSKLLMATGMDIVRRRLAKQKKFILRYSLAKRHTKVKMLTCYRDAHLYAFPHWVKDLARRQERFFSVSEDLIGLWAKSTWQHGLGEKLGITSLEQDKSPRSDDHRHRSTTLCQRQNGSPEVPPLLAYLHAGSTPLVRRVDSPALLLSVSLQLARLESVEEAVNTTSLSPFAHEQKIASPESIAPQCFISKADCLLGPNVIVEEKAAIKETCIGPNSRIRSGARLTRCVVLDNAVIGERCVLTGCIIGSRCTIGRDSVLQDCEVQEGHVVSEGTEAKREKCMPLFEDLEEL